MLVVLDSNILLSALISPVGIPAAIHEAWFGGRFELVTCAEQLEEIRRASRYPKLRAILQPHLVGRMVNSMQRARVVALREKRHEADDPTDSFLLNLADGAAVDWLVTGDKRSGLLARRKVGRAAIVGARVFCTKVLGVEG